jgi:four helix bundle protein
MTPEELRERTRKFAVRVVKLYQALPKSDEGRILGRQFLRCGTSVGANYRAVCLSRSKAEFISKITVVLEEADETEFWLELMQDTGVLGKGKDGGLVQEAHELTLIFGASLRTAKSSQRPPGADR